MRPVQRQRGPDERGLIAADRGEIGGKQSAGHLFQFLFGGFFQIFDHRQRRAAHLRFQFGDQRVQQFLPVLIAWQNVDIQRRLTLIVGFFDACSEIHLQRMVIQHHFLGMGDQRSKAQVISQRVILSQFAQTLGATVIQIFEPGE